MLGSVFSLNSGSTHVRGKEGAVQQGSSRASTTFGVAVAAATGVTSLVAHGIGSAMMPSGVQVLCLLLACVAMTAVARPMPRRTGPFAALMVAGQLVAHLALSLGGVMTAVSAASGEAGSADGMGHDSAAAVMTPMNHPHPGPMALAHLVGTVFAVLLVHGILAIGAAARRAHSGLLGRLAVPRAPRVVQRRAVWRTVVVRGRRWQIAAPLRGPPRVVAPALP